jgi:hypothetical protein
MEHRKAGKKSQKSFRHLSPAIGIKQNVLTVNLTVKVGGSWRERFLPSALDHSRHEWISFTA